VSLDKSIVTRIVVRRNQSLGPAGLARFLAAGLILHLGVAALAGVAGWWPVVAFVGAAFLVLAGTVLGVMAAGAQREVITVRSGTVTIEYGRGRPEARVELERYWARVERGAEARSGLVLRSGGVQAEVGRALTESERSELHRRLAALVGPDAAVTSGRERAVATA